MSPYALQVRPVPVRVVGFDGLSRAGTVFLHLASERANGPETLGDRLNDPEVCFLPLRVGERVELVHLEWVAQVEAAADLSELDQWLQVGARCAPVEIELVTGERLSGEFVYALPAGGQRVSDLLNRTTLRFFLLLNGATARYLQRRALLRVWT
jgi:hypothetical protein